MRRKIQASLERQFGAYGPARVSEGKDAIAFGWSTDWRGVELVFEADSPVGKFAVIAYKYSHDFEMLVHAYFVADEAPKAFSGLFLALRWMTLYPDSDELL